MNRFFFASYLVFYKEICHYRLKNKCYGAAEILSITLFAAGKLICMIMFVFHYAFVRICLSAFFFYFLYIPLLH